MVFSSHLSPGTLLRLYRRFLKDVRLDSGESVAAHSAKTGSMPGVSQPGSWVWRSCSFDPKRELTWLDLVTCGTLSRRAVTLSAAGTSP